MILEILSVTHRSPWNLRSGAFEIRPQRFSATDHLPLQPSQLGIPLLQRKEPMFRTIPARRAARLTRTLATHAEKSREVGSNTRPWVRQEIQAIYDTPLLDLVFRAASVHRQYHDPSKVQLCTLMNIKSAFASPAVIPLSFSVINIFFPSRRVLRGL